MNKRLTLRVALILTAVLIFAAVLMSVFVFTAAGTTANAEVGRYQLGSDLYVELYLNDELADYGLYDEFPGEKFPLDTSYPDYSIRALFFDGQDTPISTKSYYRWLDVTWSAPQETMYEEQGTHVKCWYRADDPATTLEGKAVIAYTYFEVSKSKLPDGVVKIGGDFGPDYMVNERDHYREGESPADRIVLDSDGGNIDTTGLTVTTVKWAAGTQTEMDLLDNTTWSDDWDAFYTETPWAGTQMTFGVVVSSNDQYLSTVCTVPFTVHKNKVYVRPVQTTFEYWGNAITPAVKFYEHRVSEDCLVANPKGKYANATDPAGDIGTYPVYGRLDAMDFVTMQNYEVVNGDPEAYFTIVPRTLAFTWTIGETTLTGAEWAEYRNDPASPKDQNVVWFPAAFTYNGAEQLPELTVTNRGFYTPEIHASGATKEQYDGSVWTTVSSFVLPDCVGYRYEITAVDEHNYVLPTDGSTIIEFRILRAPLTLSWTPDDFIYDGTGKSVTATITGGILSGEEVSIGGYSNNTKIGAGDYVASVTLSGNNASNYTADGHAWSISKATLTVKANDNSITYGDAPANNGVTYIGFVDGEDEGGITGTPTFTYSYEQYGAVGNSYTITPAGLSHSDYDITFTAGTLTVEKKTLTIKASDLSVVYGTGSIVFAPDYVGFVGMDDEGVLTGLDSLNYTTVYEQYDDVGPYDVTPSGTVSAANYAIEYGVGTLTVEQLEVSIVWSGLDGFTTVYNGAEQTVVTGATVSNKVNNDDVSLTVTGGKGTNVSNETHLATAALAGAKAGNYKLPADPTHSFTITPKPVSVSAIADDMTYSGEEKGVEASYTNALGQDVNIASAQITYTNYVSRVNYTGNSFYAYAEVIDSNYTLVGGGNTIENGKAKFGPYAITKRGVKATINSDLNAETLVYTGGVKQLLSGSIKFGPVSGEARNLIITRHNGNNVDVTAEGFTVSFRLSTDDAVNYVLIAEESGPNAYTVTDGVGTTVNPWVITPASMTVNAVNQSGTMTYNGVEQTPYIHTQVSVVHWQPITYSYSKTEGSNYAALDQITYKDVADSGTLYYKFTAPNHYDVTGSIQISMVPKALTPSITGFEVQYTYGDAFEVSFSGVADSLVGEDTLDLQGITQAYEYSSYVNKAWSDWASLTLPGMVEIRNAGQHKIRYNFTCTSGNYVSHGAVIRETLIVHKALTITPVDGQSKTYGEDDPVFTYTVSGSQYDDNIVPGDTFFSGKLERAYGFDAGTYAFERGSLVVKAPYSANYYMGEITEGKVFTINKATLTVTADDKTVIYGDAAPTYSATITGFVNLETEAQLRQDNKLSGAAAFSCSYAAKDGVGSCTITPSAGTLAATNYDFEYAAGTLTINAKVLTLSVVDYAASYTYGDEFYYDLDGLEGYLLSGDTTLNQGIHTTYEYRYKANLSDEWEDWESDYGLECIYHNPVGYYQIKFDFTCDSGNYIPAAAALSDVIPLVPKTLTVTAKPHTITYGAAPANDGVTYSGFAYSEDEGELEGALAYVYSYEQYGAVGEYTITLSGLTASNYAIEFAEGVLTVQNADFDVIVSPRQNGKLTYNGVVQRASVSYTISSVHDEYVTHMYCKTENGTYVTLNELDYLNVADAGTLYFKFTAPNHNEYAGSFLVTMDKATLTITAKPKTIAYGAAPANAGVTYSGFKGNDSTLSLTGTLAYAYTYEQGNGVGNYTITPSGVSNDNYDITFVPGVLTVEKAALTVKAKDRNKFYGSQGTQGLSVFYFGLVNGEDESVLGGTLAFDCEYDREDPDHRASGTYDIVPKGLTSDNYEITFEKGTLTIKPRLVTVTANPKTITYGEAPANDGVTYSDDFVFGETSDVFTSQVGYEYTYAQYGAVGTYAITPSGAIADNYIFWYEGGILTVEKAALTVTPTSGQSKDYGALDPVFTYDVTGAVNNEEPVFAGALSRVEGEDVGAYDITIGTLALTDDEVNGNYEISFAAGVKFSVDKVNLTITVSVAGWTYGESAIVPEVGAGIQITGWKVDADATLDDGRFLYVLYIPKDGAMTFEEQQTLIMASVDWDDDAAVEEFFATYTAVPTDAGAYYAVVGLEDLANYNDAQGATEFSILQRPVSLTWTDHAGFVYSGSAFTVSATVSNKVGTDDVSVTGYEGNSAIGAGNYTATALGVSNANYTLTDGAALSYDWSIAKAPLTVTAKDRDVTYGNQKGVLTIGDVIFNGFVNGESVANLGGTLSFYCGYTVGSAAGSKHDIFIGDLTSDNYEISFVKGTLTVTKRQVTVVYTETAPLSYEYGDPSVYGINIGSYVGLSGDGLAAGDSFDDIAAVTVAAGANKATATPLTTINGANFGYVTTYWLYLIVKPNGNYQVTNGFGDNAKLVITPKALTIRANNASVKYGEEAPEFSVSYEGFVTTVTLGGHDFNYNDSEAKLTGTLAFDCDYQAGAAAGSEFAITPKGVSNGNYSITFVPGALTVTKRQVTVIYTETAPLSYEYGDPSVYGINIGSYVGLSGDGLAAGDSFDDIAAVTVAAGANKATATPLTTINGANFGYVTTYWLYLIVKPNGNYQVTNGFGDNAKLVITPKALIIRANNASVKYGEEAPAFSVSYEGFVTTVTLGGHDFNYNDSEAKLTGTLAFACDYDVADSANRAVGTYDIIPSGVSNGNYSITFEPGALTVTKRAITIGNTNAEPLSYVYGDASVYNLAISSVLGIGGDGFVNGDTFADVAAVTLAVGATRETASPILQQLSGSNFGYAATYWLYVIPRNANYGVTVDFDDNAKLVISPKELTITVDNKTVTYGDAAPEFSVKTTGFVGGNYNDSLLKHKDGKDLTFACDYDVTAAATRGVGTYAITAGNWENGNYEVTFVPGTLTVVKKSVSITWGETNLVYNKTAQMPVFTLGGMAFGDETPEVDVTVSDVAVNVGNYTVTLSGISDQNYKLPVETSKTFTIVRRAATVTVDNKESEVENDLVELTAVATGILEGDVVYTLSTTANNEAAGVYPIQVNLTGNGNYYVTAINGTYTVTTDVTIGTGEDGTKIVEGKGSLDKDAVKEGDGVSIKKLIKKVIDAAAEAPVASLSIEIGDGAIVTFNKSALTELAKADEVKITYVETLADDIDKSIKSIKNAELVIEISLGDATFTGGTATISTAFDNKAPKGKKAVVYYVDENGKKTDMKATFKDGTVTFSTGHFSTYAVEYVLSGGAIAGIVIGCVVGAAAIGFCVYFFLFRKKGKKTAEAE